MNSLLIICLLAGIVVRRYLPFPEQMVPSINWWLITIALPCIILTLIPHTDLNSHALFPIAGMWIVFAGALLLSLLMGKVFNWSREVTGVVTLISGIGNTSFMGFPIISSYYGPEGLKLAVLADQPGSFIILSTAGIVVMAICSGQAPTLKMILKKIITFPPLIALVLSLFLKPFGGLPVLIEQPLRQIGATMTPLALFCVGLQIVLRPPQGAVVPLVTGLLWKLLLAPLVILLIAPFLHIAPLIKNVTVLQGGMAPMIAASILAQRAGLKPSLAIAIQGYGIIGSFITLPLWHWVL